MILEGIFNILFGIVNGFLELLPDMEFGLDESVFTNFCEILKILSYFIPLDTVAAILGIILAINTFKVVISFLKTIWQIIPFL